MKITRLFIVVFFVFAFCSCNSNEDNDKSIQFNVDKKLLGETFSVDSLNFSFSVPQGWQPVADSTRNQIREKLKSESFTKYQIHLDLISFYLDSVSSSFCSVSKMIINGNPQRKDLVRSLYESYSEIYKNQAVRVDSFFIDKMEISQFIISSDRLVMFKLVFSIKENLFQLDYAIDQKNYTHYLRKIESSIGSLSF